MCLKTCIYIEWCNIVSYDSEATLPCEIQTSSNGVGESNETKDSVTIYLLDKTKLATGWYFDYLLTFKRSIQNIFGWLVGSRNAYQVLKVFQFNFLVKFCRSKVLENCTWKNCQRISGDITWCTLWMPYLLRRTWVLWGRGFWSKVQTLLLVPYGRSRVCKGRRFDSIGRGNYLSAWHILCPPRGRVSNPNWPSGKLCTRNRRGGTKVELKRWNLMTLC